MRLKDFTEAGQARGLFASLLVTLLAVILQATVTLAHTQQSNCKHKYPKVDDELHHVSLEVITCVWRVVCFFAKFTCGECLQENNIHRAHRIRKRSMEQDLRIEVFYHDSVERLSRDKRNIVKEIVSSGQTTRIEYLWGQGGRKL